MSLRTVQCTRYVTPLREGGSLPAIVEASDQGMYVMKFRGAGQGPKALVAEVIGAGLARALGLPVPELVMIELDAPLTRLEADPEIQELLKRSCGLNLALDYLPGSVTYDPVAGPALGPTLSSEIVWLDALITNVDRTPRNANMLWWHKQAWLIDHGAALHFHHNWERYLSLDAQPFPAIKDHVLLPQATALPLAHARLRPLVTRALLQEVLQQVPDTWLLPEDQLPNAAAHRDAYVTLLMKRVESSTAMTQEAEDARARAL
jgi:hypothetical protein